MTHFGFFLQVEVVDFLKLALLASVRQPIITRVLHTSRKKKVALLPWSDAWGSSVSAPRSGPPCAVMTGVALSLLMS